MRYRNKVGFFIDMKNCFLIILLIAIGGAHQSLAQNNTSSPYSAYGLGELSPVGTGQTLGFSGASLSFKNRSCLSVNNPASLAAIDSLKFIFNLGFTSKFSNLNQQGKSDTFMDNNLSQLSFGFRISPVVSTAVSLIPYSNVGYDISTLEKVNGSSDYFQHKLSGTGGLNQLILTNGFVVTKNLYLGVNAVFLFGNNTSNELIILESASSSTYEKLISQGIFGNVGLQYHGSLSGNWDFSIGAKYQPELQVSAKREKEVINSNIVILENTLDRGSFDVPMTYGLGLGFTKKKQLWFGADYLHEAWSSTKIFKKSSELVDRDRFSVGMNYIANDGYATKFLKKLTYRFGAFYDTGYIEIEDERIKTKGFSFGLGIPMARQKGMINISFEFGQMGTTDNNNVREDYGRFTLEMSLFERWFVKRKYQ